MSLRSQQITALFNGVSQQPATLRLDSQLQAMVNCYATVADGIRKRPPTQNIAQLTTADLSSAFIHTINRDTAERYVVSVTDGDLTVHDIDGVAKTVVFPNGKEYLSVEGGGTAAESFALVSVADYTFMVNKSIPVAMDVTNTGDTLPAGWANYFLPGNWSAIHSDGSQYYSPGTYTYKGTKQTFTDLPPTTDNPLEGDVWKIAGLDTSAFGAFYVRRTGGVWEETFGPNQWNRLNELTMPWALVRESDGTFTFAPFKWNVRKIGDDDSNPPPSFVGRYIKDVFFYKNRLAFVSDENVIFSGAGDYGNFFRSTATALIDSDLVDVAVSSTKVSLLEFAVPFNNNLMLFADQTQFSLNVDQLLTPSTVSIDETTSFEMNTRARPVGIGNDVYFSTESGAYSRIREYFVQEGTSNGTDASDVTAHVPKYVPSNIFKLAGNSNEDVLFAISDKSGERNRVYVYKFYWDSDDKAQSCWSYWEHGDASCEILSIEVLENELYLVVDYGANGTYLEKCNVQSGQVTGALDFEVLLDRGDEVTGVYNGGGDYTAFTLPYVVDAADQADFKLVRGADFAGEVGSLMDPTQYTWFSTTEIRYPGDESAGEVHIGQNYSSSFTFSEQFTKSRNGTAVTTGRLQMRTMVIYYTDTAYFKTSVDPYGAGSPEVEEVTPAGVSLYSGKTVGAASLTLGSPSFDTGQYAFTLNANSRDMVLSIENDTHVQSNLQSAEWEALYHNRAR